MSSQNDFHVLIIGSGLGGLSLAQSLRRSEISFQVFERDNSPFDRPQGYRLHLDGDAINTVREVLPPQLQERFNETSYFTKPYTDIMNIKNLQIIKRILTTDDLGSGLWPTKDDGDQHPEHANVDRATLRNILLTGLEESILFGKRFERYQESESGVIAFFSDGTTATGSVLVGADGVNSKVRRQGVPELRTMDAGITAIYGRLPVDSIEQVGAAKEILEDIFAIGSDGRKVFLGLGAVVFQDKEREGGTDQEKSYAVCIIGGRHQFFPENISMLDSRELRMAAIELLSAKEGWSDRAADLLRTADDKSFFVVKMRTSVPPNDADNGKSPLGSMPARVTLLGDAVHSMTPSLGRGANLAMRHGALLGRHLKEAGKGKSELVDELLRYEKSMSEYGFRVVKEAAEIGRQRMAQNALRSEI